MTAIEHPRSSRPTARRAGLPRAGSPRAGSPRAGSPPAGSPRAGSPRAGFTVIELIVVLLVIGILGAAAAARFFDNQAFEAAEFADETRSMLGFGQKVAVAQSRPVYVYLNAGAIGLCFVADPNCPAASQVAAPGGRNSGRAVTLARCGGSATWLCEAVPDGASYAAVPAVAGFYFDALGKPFALADAPGSAASTFAKVQLTVTGSVSARNVIIEHETGYVH